MAFDPVRIKALEEILVKLHNGASPESVQEEFDQHFTGVSAVEISLMEHELMNGDSGVTFEDVMVLCNVHANLFKGKVDGAEVPEADKPGHPVHVLKMENAALRSALYRVERLHKALRESKDLEADAGLVQGLKRQYDLIGQFENHYDRKENLIFTIMERHGHDSPPKVMWGVDDQIRDLFHEAKVALNDLTADTVEATISKWEAFAHEFKEMIFKEEAILIPLTLSFFSEDDWLSVARESDAYGYTIVQPEEVWQPARKSFENEENTEEEETAPSTEGYFKFGHGHLTLKEVDLILNHLPIEITFVNKDNIFQYYNDKDEPKDMLFPRTPGQVGRDMELCHPPKLLDKVRTLVADLRAGRRETEAMWFPKKDKLVYITYTAVRDENGEFQGILECVHDVAPYKAAEGVKRDLTPLEGDLNG